MLLILYMTAEDVVNTIMKNQKANDVTVQLVNFPSDDESKEVDVDGRGLTLV